MKYEYCAIACWKDNFQGWWWRIFDQHGGFVTASDDSSKSKREAFKAGQRWLNKKIEEQPTQPRPSE